MKNGRVVTKYQGYLDTAHVTEVWVDGVLVGEVDVYPATGVSLTRIEAVVLVVGPGRELSHKTIFSEAAANRRGAALKAAAIKALVDYAEAA